MPLSPAHDELAPGDGSLRAVLEADAARTAQPHLVWQGCDACRKTWVAVDPGLIECPLCGSRTAIGEVIER